MRLRITFAKTGALRYIGHLDLHKMWERTARRAGLPLAYSQGFHPQPRLQLASALPLGHSSRCEVLDIWIKSDMDLASLPGLIQGAVPTGLKILSVETVDESAPPLQTMIISSEFEVTLLDEVDPDQLARSLSALMEAESILRERRRKPYDLRPLIENLSFKTEVEGQNGRIFMRLAAREGATGRPDEVLDALGIPLESTRIERTRLIFKD
jgi:radical SAM-linked protein